MLTYTNMAWPEQPYGASQRPFGQAPRLLAAITLDWVKHDDAEVPLCASIVYVRLARRDTITLNERAFAFGFRTAHADQPTDWSELVRLVDTDLVRSRVHAQVLAAYGFADYLAALRAAAGEIPVPGVTAVERAWTAREVVQRGRARLFDTHQDTTAPEPVGLAAACRNLALEVDLAGPGMSAELHAAYRRTADPAAAERLALANLRRALSVALVALATLDLYRWDGPPVTVDRLLHANAWDCFPNLLPATSSPPA
jgi:hypothetical protein